MRVFVCVVERDLPWHDDPCVCRAEVPDGVLAAAPAAGAHGRGAPGPGRQGVGGALHPQHEGPAVARVVRLRARQLPRGRGLLRLRARRRRRVPRPRLPRRRPAGPGGQAPGATRLIINALARGAPPRWPSVYSIGVVRNR